MIVAVVPVKPLHEALGRLAGVLGSEERRELQEAMLHDVLDACAAAESIDEVVVVTCDPDAAAIAYEHGVGTMPDHVPPRGMNAAVGLGLAYASESGADAAIVVTADLPLADGDDLDALVSGLPGRPGVAIAPSLDWTGTNVMVLAPADALRPELGIGSLERHTVQAAVRGVGLLLVDRPRLALDIDTPSDLTMLGRSRESSLARVTCERLRLGHYAPVAGAR